MAANDPRGPRLRDDPVFRDLAAQVHAQDMLLDAISVGVFAMLPPDLRRDLVAQMRSTAADIGAKGTLSDANAEFKADVKVRALGLLEKRLTILAPE